MNEFGYERDDGSIGHPPMTSKMVGINLRRGQRVRLDTPGGGGYGHPEERAPEQRARDLALGYVTRGDE